jgi:hypothetical protein
MEGQIGERLKRISQIDALVASLIEERTRVFGEILAAQNRQNQLFQSVDTRGGVQTKSQPQAFQPPYQRGPRFQGTPRPYQTRQQQANVVELYRSINVRTPTTH